MSEQCNESPPDRHEYVEDVSLQIEKFFVGMQYCPECNQIEELREHWQAALHACVAVVDDAAYALTDDQSVQLTITIEHIGDSMFDVSYSQSAIVSAPAQTD